MILNFSVQNFGSIKDKQTLSFEADNSSHLEDAYIVNIKGQRILKLALIFGANASGKTTLLKALEFLRDIVLNPESKKDDKLDFKPFLFTANPYEHDSIISIEFFQNEIKYSYEVVFRQQAILSEELFFYSPNKANVFSRKTDLSNQFTEITFGSKISADKVFKKTLEANTLWNNTVLGGFQKTNININELKEVIDWFSNHLKPLVHSNTDLERYTLARIDQKDIAKSDVVHILKKADFNISDIVIEQKEVEMPERLLELFKGKANLPDDEMKKLDSTKKVTTYSVDFEHTVDGIKYNLPLDNESEGTKRYYGFAGLLALLIQKPTTIPIDELEASLHPDLYTHFIVTFLQNTNSSQIIATTHNREILDNKDVFRNDAIWFTDKQNSCSTELYSLIDFDSQVIRNTTNILNAYKSGKLSGTPNLGDTFIDLKR